MRMWAHPHQSNDHFKPNRIVRTLKKTIKTPTKIINAFKGNFFTKSAANGAAMAPPISKPRMIC